MGACFYRLRCEVFQNLFLSPMNTGFVRPAVATVLTACGIETSTPFWTSRCCSNQLQQYLPLAVLKRFCRQHRVLPHLISCNSTYRLRYWNLSRGLPTAQFNQGCNSTYRLRYWNIISTFLVLGKACDRCNSTYRLRYWNTKSVPLTSPSPGCNSTYRLRYWNDLTLSIFGYLASVATVLTACGIETHFQKCQ